MPKLEVRMFEKTNSTPPNYTNRNKELVRTIPVSEAKREACKAIQLGLKAQIEERINLERPAKEAAEPFRQLKEKLSNPRIKRKRKANSPL